MYADDRKEVGDNPIFDKVTGLPPDVWRLEPFVRDGTMSDPEPDVWRWVPEFSEKQKKAFGMPSEPPIKVNYTKGPHPIRTHSTPGYVPIYDKTMADPNPSPESWMSQTDHNKWMRNPGFNSTPGNSKNDFVMPASGSFMNLRPSSVLSPTPVVESPSLEYLKNKTEMQRFSYSPKITKKSAFPRKKLIFDSPSKKRFETKTTRNNLLDYEEEDLELQENLEAGGSSILKAVNLDASALKLREDKKIKNNFIAITPTKTQRMGYIQKSRDFAAYKGNSPIPSNKKFEKTDDSSPLPQNFGNYKGYTPARAPKKRKSIELTSSTPTRPFSGSPRTPDKVSDVFVVTPVRRLFVTSSAPQLSPSKKVLVQELKRGFVESFRNKNDTELLRRVSAVLNRHKVKQLRANTRSHYDAVISDLPTKPRHLFFLQHVDLYYLSDAQWILPGQYYPFWVSHPNFVLQDLVNPNFKIFLKYLANIDENLNTLSTKNKENTKTPQPDIKSAISVTSSIGDQVKIEGKMNSNLQKDATWVLKTNLKGSSCVFFNDCYKTIIGFEEEITQQPKSLLDSDQSFSLILLGDAKEGLPGEVWGIRLPKTCIGITLKQKNTMQEIPHLEMGAGITMRNAELSVILTTEGDDAVRSLFEKGDIFKSDDGKLNMLESNWKNQLITSGRENVMQINQVNKKSENTVVHIKGVQENDKWIIFRKAISSLKDKNFVLSFTIPYVPSKGVPDDDRFKKTAWFFHHNYVIGSPTMMENVRFQPNVALSRKTLSLNFGSVYLKKAYGISMSQNDIFVPKSAIAGDLEEDEASMENDIDDNNTGRKRTKERSKAYLKSFSPETASAPPSSSYSRSSENYGTKISSSMQKIEVEEGSFVAKDTPMTCFTDLRDTKSDVIHYVVISNSDLPNLSDLNLRPVIKQIKSMLSITVVEDDNKRTLFSDNSRLTVYMEDGLEFKTIDSMQIQEGEPLLLDMDFTDNSMVLKDFNTSRVSNAEITQITNTLTCTASIKIRRDSCKNGVTLIYDGRQDILVDDPANLSQWEDLDVHISNNLTMENNKPLLAFFNSKRRELDNTPKVLHLDVEKLLQWKESESVKTLTIPLKFVNKN